MNQPRVALVVFVRGRTEETAGLLAAGQLSQYQQALASKLVEAMPADLELDHIFGEFADVDGAGNPVIG